MTTARPFDGLSVLHYGAIVADPPWTYENWSLKGTGRNAGNHYDCMPLDAIMALPVGHLAAPDCALFLWSTGPHMPAVIDVMRAWGFRFSGKAFCWGKRRRCADPDDRADEPGSWHMGMGYTSRANTEDCWLGLIGRPRRQDAGVRELIIAPVREHSRKPDELYRRVERLYPGPYLDLFSRQRRAGWDAWGREVGRFADA